MSNRSTIRNESSLLRNLFAYCQQRFPVGSYSVLVLLFFGSAMAVFQENVDFDSSWVGAIVMWLGFFQLRIFDEFKDFRQDRFTYPNRLLSQGVLTLSLLGRIALFSIFLQCILSIFISSSAFWTWTIVLGFSLLMRIEFGFGSWLEKRMLLYAITHNPIVALLGFFAWGCTEQQWDWQYLWYLAAVSFASFAFEIGRKTMQSEEENHSVASYSSVYGLSKALMIMRVSVFIATFCCAVTLFRFGQQTAVPVGEIILSLAVVSFIVLVKETSLGKKIELGATLYLLMMLLSIGVGTW